MGPLFWLILFLLGSSKQPAGPGWPAPAARKKKRPPMEVWTMPKAPPAIVPKVTPKPPRRKKGIGVPLGTRPTKGWTPYPSPLPQLVINTAVSVLRQRIHSLLGPDPKKKGGRVYYQAEYDPKGTKRRVTAWHKH